MFGTGSPQHFDFDPLLRLRRPNGQGQVYSAMDCVGQDYLVDGVTDSRDCVPSLQGR